ncbi:MAG: gluconate 2-dehydrogenase subunit 3 family protein [Saprospiraceae bacterium]
MDRRLLLKQLGFLLGATIIDFHHVFATPLLLKQKFAIFTESDIIFLDDFAEVILPETSIAGAKSAQTGKFIATIIEDCLPPQKQGILISQIQDFQNDVLQQHGKPFSSITFEQKITAIQKLAQRNSEQKNNFFQTLKTLTLTGFFTSEIGMKSALNYNPIPQAYKACIPITEHTKTNASYY